MHREFTLNKASDYLKIAVLWSKLLKGTCNKCISRKVSGLPRVNLFPLQLHFLGIFSIHEEDILLEASLSDFHLYFSVTAVC